MSSSIEEQVRNIHWPTYAFVKAYRRDGVSGALRTLKTLSSCLGPDSGRQTDFIHKDLPPLPLQALSGTLVYYVDLPNNPSTVYKATLNVFPTGEIGLYNPERFSANDTIDTKPGWDSGPQGLLGKIFQPSTQELDHLFQADVRQVDKQPTLFMDEVAAFSVGDGKRKYTFYCPIRTLALKDGGKNNISAEVGRDIRYFIDLILQPSLTVLGLTPQPH